MYTMCQASLCSGLCVILLLLLNARCIAATAGATTLGFDWTIGASLGDTGPNRTVFHVSSHWID